MKIEQQKQVLKKVVVQTECDHCHKRENGDEPGGWHHFSAGHSDWGNDSIESYDTFDACTASCWLALIRKIVEDYEPIRGEPTLMVDGFDYTFARDLLDMEER